MAIEEDAGREGSLIAITDRPLLARDRRMIGIVESGIKAGLAPYFRFFAVNHPAHPVAPLGTLVTTQVVQVMKRVQYFERRASLLS